MSKGITNIRFDPNESFKVQEQMAEALGYRLRVKIPPRSDCYCIAELRKEAAFLLTKGLADIAETNEIDEVFRGCEGNYIEAKISLPLIKDKVVKELEVKLSTAKCLSVHYEHKCETLEKQVLRYKSLTFYDRLVYLFKGKLDH